MKTILVVCIASAFLVGLGIGLTARSIHTFASERNETHASDRAGIEKLHRADIDTTVTQGPEGMSKLWSEDGVNLQTPGGPTVGIGAIKESYEKFRSEHPEFRVLKYSPEFKDLQFVEGWAIEVIDANATFKMSAKDDPVTVQNQLVRVLKRQSDGSWKFALVGPK